MKKHYHIRQYSPIWWARTIVIVGGTLFALGVINTWSLGLL